LISLQLFHFHDEVFLSGGEGDKNVGADFTTAIT
jgi:hypothetical protein